MYYINNNFNKFIQFDNSLSLKLIKENFYYSDLVEFIKLLLNINKFKINSYNLNLILILGSLSNRLMNLDLDFNNEKVKSKFEDIIKDFFGRNYILKNDSYEKFIYLIKYNNPNIIINNKICLTEYVFKSNNNFIKYLLGKSLFYTKSFYNDYLSKLSNLELTKRAVFCDKYFLDYLIKNNRFEYYIGLLSELIFYGRHKEAIEIAKDQKLIYDNEEFEYYLNLTEGVIKSIYFEYMDIEHHKLNISHGMMYVFSDINDLSRRYTDDFTSTIKLANKYHAKTPYLELSLNFKKKFRECVDSLIFTTATEETINSHKITESNINTLINLGLPLTEKNVIKLIQTYHNVSKDVFNFEITNEMQNLCDKMSFYPTGLNTETKELKKKITKYSTSKILKIVKDYKSKNKIINQYVFDQICSRKAPEAILFCLENFNVQLKSVTCSMSASNLLNEIYIPSCEIYFKKINYFQDKINQMESLMTKKQLEKLNFNKIKEKENESHDNDDEEDEQFNQIKLHDKSKENLPIKKIKKVKKY
uniref:Uncharacterized protein n=1 Tax=viral metagenome TaxID=1070528 RepID=A0A6C0ACV4_9ZZZZ